MMRAFLSTLSLAAVIGLAPGPARAQETAVRFPITQAGDTTFSFRVGEHLWVRAGMRGIVVDPRQQDVLVARFRITGLANGQANALITGQTTSVTAAHSVLLDVPSTPWYKQRTFWLGTAVGAVVGILIGAL
jgi:hypothetical protein